MKITNAQLQNKCLTPTILMSMAVCGFIITFPEKASLRSAISRPAQTEAKTTGVRPGTHTPALRCTRKCVGPGRAEILQAHKAGAALQIPQRTRSESNYSTKSQHSDRQRGQRNKRQRPETDPQIYDYLIKVLLQFREERLSVATPGAGQLGLRRDRRVLSPDSHCAQETASR